MQVLYNPALKVLSRCNLAVAPGLIHGAILGDTYALAGRWLVRSERCGAAGLRWVALGCVPPSFRLELADTCKVICCNAKQLYCIYWKIL